jgi:hypothetical protein
MHHRKYAHKENRNEQHISGQHRNDSNWFYKQRQGKMMKPVTGQYECMHSSNIGLDYFTSRIDKLTLQPNGRFVLTVQTQSRAVNAAQNFIKGQQQTGAAPETRLEGNYTQQENSIAMNFDNGGFEQVQVFPDGSGLQIGPNRFNKVSDSTILPPTQRIQKDMNDIARGLKIAGTIGGVAMKAAKALHGTVQSAQGNTPSASSQPYQPAQPAAVPQQPVAPTPAPQPQSHIPQAPSGQAGTVFCDQCGARCRPGKSFCNQCGARLS